jgi:hypothetical protein
MIASLGHCFVSKGFMKDILIALALSAPVLASAQNLLVNGSFEFGLSG